MYHDLLLTCGETLHGPRWQSDLARDLDIDDRTMRRWVAGTSPIPDGVSVDLMRLLLKRASAIDGLIETLKSNG